MNRKQLFLYATFAVIVTLINLASQRIVLSFTTGNIGFFTALFIGTLMGVVAGYLLDKKWIFLDDTKISKNYGKQFFLYAITGAIHTPIFWVTETIFWFIWMTDQMRELGAIIGLTIAYTVKYFILKSYVFKTEDYQS
tara:strand:- start:1730 stop:2143 length:414 start_codon:yes stop_codon:yes gene_type:complete